VIPAERVEQIVELKRDDPDYAFGVLKLIDRIQRELADMGKHWTLRSEAALSAC